MENKGVDKFIDDILTDKDLPGTTPEIKAMLTVDLKQRLMDQINRAIIDALPDDKFDEFDALLDKEGVDDEEVQKFIADSDIDIKQITIKTMILFCELYLQTAEGRGE